MVIGLALTACGGRGIPGGTSPSSSTTGDSSTTTTLAGAAGSGVEGTVAASPTCPVERADQPCPPRPVETEVRLVRGDGTVAARARSGADGRWRVEVAPGRYRLEADYPAGPGRGCTPIEVTVEKGRFTPADVSCDTGIR
jgi:hypothetical protein